MGSPLLEWRRAGARLSLQVRRRCHCRITNGRPHPARDQLDVAVKAEEALTKSMGQKVTFRTREAVAGFFAGRTVLAEPGVVPVQDWRPTSDLDLNSPPTAMWGGVGRKA
jgi:hypothetical protein